MKKWYVVVFYKKRESFESENFNSYGEAVKYAEKTLKKNKYEGYNVASVYEISF